MSGTKDASGSRISNEEDIDKRVKEALASEDLDIVIDICQLNQGRVTFSGSSVLNTFLNVQMYQSAAMGKSASWSRLFQLGISYIRSLDNAHLKHPFLLSLGLNFSPRNPCSKVAQHYQGRLKVKHAVQKQLFGTDEHYCAALFSVN